MSAADRILDRAGLLAIGDARLEYRIAGPLPADAPTIVLLHEGLGSAGLWRDFPDALAAATGLGVFAYSRAGYGASSPAPLPWGVRYMHDEATRVLPRVLDAIGFRRGLLVGHSDGASIAAIHAGDVRDPRVAGSSLIAPHFVVEDVSLAAIAVARLAYQTGGLRDRLARWHRDVDNAFHGWNGAWLSPDFRTWDITDALARIAVPIQIVQGGKDEYGTIRQVEVARETARGPVEVLLLDAAGHAPQRDAPAETLQAIARFCAGALDGRKMHVPGHDHAL